MPALDKAVPQDLLPDAEKLDALERAVNRFIEEEIEAVTCAVFEACNFEGEQSVTFEQVGRLVTWVRDVRRFHIEPLLEHLQNFEEVVLDELPNIAIAGKQELGPKFDNHGYKRDPEVEYRKLVKKLSEVVGVDA